MPRVSLNESKPSMISLIHLVPGTSDVGAGSSLTRLYALARHRLDQA